MTRPLILILIGTLFLSAQTQSPPPNDPSARKFLKEAEDRAASWQGFPGFTAEAKVYRDGLTHSGSVTITSDGRVRVELADPEAKKWATKVLLSVVVSGTRKSFEQRYENVGVVFGRDDFHPLGQLVELHGDPYNSRFRVLEGEVRSIERSTQTQNIFLTILSIERDEENRKRARTFVVYYFDKKTGNLARSEAIVDHRVVVSDFILPEVWKEVTLQTGAPATQALTLTAHKLLPEIPKTPNGKTP